MTLVTRNKLEFFKVILMYYITILICVRLLIWGDRWKKKRV